MSLLPRMQAGPYLWEVENPASQSAWQQPYQIGTVEDAPEDEWNPSGEEIVGDNLGDTVQDVLFRGGPLYVSMVVQEFGTTAWRIVQPYYNRSAVPNELNQAIGDGGLASVGMFARATVHDTATNVGTFRLRATALHPAFSTMRPYQIYFNAATLAVNQPVTFRRGTRLKNVGVRFLILPEHAYDDPAGDQVPNTANPLVFYQTILTQPAGP